MSTAYELANCCENNLDNQDRIQYASKTFMNILLIARYIYNGSHIAKALLVTHTANNPLKLLS